jgi:lipopolysaccharide transport system permease protein
MSETVYKELPDHWDIVLEPKSSFFKLNLKEVWRYRDLMWLFVRRDFVAQYKQTILGPLWHIIQPLLTTVIFLFLFRKVARIGTDEIEPTLFYMSGITIWNYFSGCITNTSTTFVTNAGIFGKVYFPRLVMPLSIVVSNIIRLGIQFGVLLLFIIYYQLFKDVPIHLSLYWLVIPFLILLMAGIGFGLGVIISSLTTKYRDLSLLLTFAVQLAMYITPVAYPYSYLAGTSYKWVLNVNPLTSIVEGFRYCLFGKATVIPAQLLYSCGFMIIVVLLGALIFNKVEKSFMDTV